MDDILMEMRENMKQTKHIHSSKTNAVRKTDFRLWGVAAIIAATALLTSCVKDELYNTPHPDKGAVVVTADWSDAVVAGDIPTSYFLSMDGGAAKQATGTACCYPELLVPGKHSLLLYNEPQGIAVEGTTAKVRLLGDGTAEPMPDYLFSAGTELEVVQDDTLRVTVSMLRRICPITMEFSLTGENACSVARIEATLEGLAGSVDFRSGTVGTENLATRLVVEQAENNARAYTEGRIEMKCRVLGINSRERQMLTIKVTMEDGYISTVTSDLTELLKDLNTDMEPVELTGTMEIPQDGHFSGTITDWKPGNGSDGDDIIAQ